MHTRPVLFRLSAALALAGTASAAVIPGTALAQAAPGDPPARVGRLARMSGTVSFHTADQQAWGPATLNYPVTSGNAFWTEPGGSAEIEIGATHLALDQQTELDIEGLDNLQLTATEPQGAVYLRLRMVNPGEATLIRTPRGSVRITTMGRYEVVAGDTERPTTVTVVEGAAQITGPDDLSISVGPHQTATISGTDHFQSNVGPEVDDPFLTAQLQAERPVTPAAYQPPPVVQQMTGVEDLGSVGKWVEAPQYGHVWYPPVDPGWVPYRHGHWSYVAPWGWTWVDDASWGFAPYHYGRWVEVDDRWGWVPVAPEAPVEVAPVYSPALVDFVGIAAGVAVGAAIGVGVGLALGGGNVGWVPLGYREPYLPPYGGSAAYINRINSPNFSRTQNVGTLIDQRRSFVNNGTITRNTTVINNYYSNAAGATVASAEVMQRGQPVAAAAHPVTAQQFAQIAQPRVQPPVRPTAQTPGITPAVAHKYNIPPTQLVRPVAAPGPAVAPHPTGPIALRPPGQGAARPPGTEEHGLAPAAAVAGGAAVGAAAASVAHPGLPTLATPHGAAPPARPPVVPGSAPVAHPAPGPAIHPPGSPNAPPPLLTPHPAVPGAPHIAAPQVAVPHAAAPVAVPHVAAPAAVPHVTAPAAVPHVTAPVAVPHVATPAAVPHVTAPAMAPHVAPPYVASHVTVPAPVHMAPQQAMHPAPVHVPPPQPHSVAPHPEPRPAPPHKVCPPGHPC